MSVLKSEAKGKYPEDWDMNPVFNTAMQEVLVFGSRVFDNDGVEGTYLGHQKETTALIAYDGLGLGTCGMEYVRNLYR